MLNRVVLIGRLTADPELRYTPSGLPVATFRLAVNRMRTQSGQQEADFFNVVVWQKTAEFAANYLNKGRLVAVDGRLQARQWTTNDGQKRTTVEVVGERVQALERRREEAGAPAGEPEMPSDLPEPADVSEGLDTPGPWEDQ
jgi:single-strand DNA-binding protein